MLPAVSASSVAKAQAELCGAAAIAGRRVGRGGRHFAELEASTRPIQCLNWPPLRLLATPGLGLRHPSAQHLEHTLAVCMPTVATSICDFVDRQSCCDTDLKSGMFADTSAAS
eukprot:jgi/Chlat1/1714/Chrsp127S08676